MKVKLKANVIPFRSVRGRSTRPFVALHRFRGQVVRRTFASTMQSAIKFSTEHLWLDSYGATSVAIYNRRTEQQVATLATNGTSIVIRRTK